MHYIVLRCVLKLGVGVLKRGYNLFTTRVTLYQNRGQTFRHRRKKFYLNYFIMKGFTVDHLNATVHEDIYCVPAWIKIKKDTR